ncbi:MAG: ABC transporter permease [Bryobacterales bacterium]|nr:ABC transporter permease [Bryobacterales bacterium]
MKVAAAVLLLLLSLAALSASWIAPDGGQMQFRDHINEPPSSQFPLGTDPLGRDRFARLLSGARISLLLAPAAALLAVLLGAVIGIAAGLRSGWLAHLLSAACDLTLALPWFFLLLTLRALIPIDVAPPVSLLVTFALLGLLGWAGPARVVQAGVHLTLRAPHILALRARGAAPLRVLTRHLLPELAPLLAGQFLALAPVFLLAEANLGLLGLGVSEPMASWGNLLKELESVAVAGPAALLHSWWLLAPLAGLLLSTGSLFILAPREVTP